MIYKNNYKYKFLTLFFLCVCHCGFSQVINPQENAKSGIYLLSKSFGDSVVLRWAPDNTDAWLFGNNYGYNIYRYKVVSDNNKIIDDPVRKYISNGPVKPMKVEEIERKFGNDTYAAVVAQAIYGSSFDLKSNDKNTAFMNLATGLNNRYSFALFSCDMSFNAAKAHGLVFTDRNVAYGEKYLYCIKPNWGDSMLKCDSALVFISVNDTFSVPKPVGVYAGFDGQTVTLSWEAESMKEAFTAYQVERSDDGGKTFKKINRQPLVNITPGNVKRLPRMVYMDTIPQTDKEYFYRVRGLTPFGETSSPSDVVSGKGEMVIVGVNPIIISSENLKDDGIRINWEFPEGYEKHLKGFTVERADKAEGFYKLISDTLSLNQRSFIDKRAKTVNYYQVCAISTSGRAYCSFPSLAQLPDSVPPAIPKGLKGTVDSSGIVKLTWERNTEEDFMSFKLYRSNNPQQGFVQINNKTLTAENYIDTVALNNLTRKVYYAITAQDMNYNESEYSIPLMITKPDTIPPVSPVIKNYKVQGSKVALEWLASTSNDVALHRVYRKTGNEKTWEIICSFNINRQQGVYTDSTINGGGFYTYKITAIDEAGLESLNNKEITVKTGNAIPETDLGIKIFKNPDGKSVVISWKKSDTGIEKILIYKCVNGENLFLFRSVDYGELKLTDPDVKIGDMYGYRMQLMMQNGARSHLSNEFTINF